MRGLAGFSRSRRRRTLSRSKRHGSACKLRAERQRTPLKPRRGGQRIISPRSTVRMIVWVKWLIAIYSAKKRSRIGAEQKRARAFERPAFQDERDLEPARRGCARRLTQPPHGRARREAAHSTDLGVGRGVGKIGEQNQRLAKRLGAVVGPVGEPQMIEAQHADEAPGDLARRRVQSSSLDRGERRLERFGRTADAGELKLRRRRGSGSRRRSRPPEGARRDAGWCRAPRR